MSLGNFIKRFRDITRNDAGINGDAQRIEQLTWMLFLKIYDDLEIEKSLVDNNYTSIIPEGFHWHEWANTEDDSALKGDELLDFVDNQLFPTLQNLQIHQGCSKFQSVVKMVFEDIYNYMKDGVLLHQVLQLINEFDFTDPEESHTFGTIYETILRQLQSAGAAGEFYTPRALTDFMAAHVSLKLGDTVADFACGTGGFLNSARKLLAPVAEAGTNKDRDLLNNSFYGIEKKPLPYLLCVTNLLLNRVEVPNITHGNSLTRKVDDYKESDKFSVILMNPPYGGSELPEIQQNFPTKLKSAETADLFMILIMNRLKSNGRAAVVVPDGFLFGGGNKAAIKERLLKRFNLHTVLRLPATVFAPYTDIATNVLFFNGVTASEKTLEQENYWATEKTWFYRMDMPEGYKAFSKTKPLLLEHMLSVDEWWNNRTEIEIEGNPKAKAFTPTELKDVNFNFDHCGFITTEEEILPPKDLIQKYQIEREAQEEIIDKTLKEILFIVEKKE